MFIFTLVEIGAALLLLLLLLRLSAQSPYVGRHNDTNFLCILVAKNCPKNMSFN